MKYAEVAIDNRSRYTDALFTYKVPDDWRLGDVIRVPFGSGNREKRGIIFGFRNEPDVEEERIKEAVIRDEVLSLSEEMVDTALWMRMRYGLTYLEAVNCFIPPGKPPKEGKEKRPLKDVEEDRQEIEKLTGEQQEACREIFEALDKGEQKNFLIHGVTGSGKTEVYMQACQRTLERGRTAIVLVPEIALTKQMTERFIGRFGADMVAILHSSLTGRERFDEWTRIRKGEARIVIGARMAVFAPLTDIGLVVMDEEHESTYKADMSPKYETVAVALKRLMKYGGVLISGSATPSVVSYNRAKEGIYRLIRLDKRYNEIKLPSVEIVDMREELRAGNRKAFSERLYRGIEEEIEGGRQVILFLNRRGYASYITCSACGNTMMCPDCGISLTYHKYENAGICHYCGRRFPIPRRCEACNSEHIRFIGLGTEQLEEQTRELFPEARVGRLDLDTAKSGRKIGKILEDFAGGKTDILIGTQLVAKGLDFRNVGLVGVAMADTTLNIPDYRSQERTFQLITQVAGRAGRGDREGKVIVQTLEPDNFAIAAAAKYDYSGFYEKEIEYRRLMNYPPFTDILVAESLSKEDDEAREIAEGWASYIRKKAAEKEPNLEVFDAKPVFHGSSGSGFRYYVMMKCPGTYRNELVFEIMKFRRRLLKMRKDASLLIDVNPYGSY